MSTSSPPEPPQFEGIEAAAEAAVDEAKGATADSRIAAIEDRLASIEPLLEQLQASSEIGPKITEYVVDLRSEQVFFNKARYAVGCLALVVVVGMLALLATAIFHVRSPLLTSPPVAIAAFVVGMVTGITILVNAFVKGVFRSTADRHSDGFLPPALEKSVELLNKVAGRN